MPNPTEALSLAIQEATASILRVLRHLPEAQTAARHQAVARLLWHLCRSNGHTVGTFQVTPKDILELTLDPSKEKEKP